MKPNPAAAGLFALTIVAMAGEWITREDTGARICKLTLTLYTEMSLQPGFCEDWQIPPISYGQTLPSESRGWINCRFRRGCQLHIEGKGWRP